jgi:hypothetical protein
MQAQTHNDDAAEATTNNATPSPRTPPVMASPPTSPPMDLFAKEVSNEQH